MDFTGWSLEQARQWLLERVERGEKCPLCKQHAKVYRRHMTSPTGRTMIAMYRYYGTDFVHIPTLAKIYLRDIAHQGGYLTLSHYWRLIEEENTVREDGGRAGYWRLTQEGVDFVKGLIKVPRKAITYDNRVLRMDDARVVSIYDVLGSKFDLRELLGE